MAIDKARGYAAVDRLKADAPARAHYLKMVDDGLSYADLMRQELGPDVAEQYLREEAAQHITLFGGRPDFESMSVPEFLVLEDDHNEELWHTEAGGYAAAKDKFAQEAAEPWHQSLRRAGYKPDPGVALWFRWRPEWIAVTQRICELAVTLKG